MTFKDLDLSEELLLALDERGYENPTPIQEQAIPYVLMNRDLLGCAQTGTGKTASFVLPMLDILDQGRARMRMPRSLILEPTRELAAQVAENFDLYGKYHKLTKALLIGGVTFDEQDKLLDRGVDVLIATPGRLLDHFERGNVLLNDVKILVIDEADRMLDMGFIPDVERIVSLMPPLRQTLMFSATMPKEIKKLADKFLSNPKEVSVDPPSTTADTVTQQMVKLGPKQKREALRGILDGEEVRNALIFCNRKRDVGIVHRSLLRHDYEAGALHGDMDQFSRMETLDKFKEDEIKYLVCSDVAARGLDIPAMSHVINFDMPTHAEDYVHRIGRTGRAGRQGHAITFVMPDEGKYIDAVQELAKGSIAEITLDGIRRTETEQYEDKPRRRGRRRGSDKKAPKETPQAKPSNEKKGKNPDKRRNEKPREKVIGFGDETPAFLTTAVKA
ncbi:MAG: DNA helicase [Rhodospirillaceae bacterium]|nr:DNA helicase [Rhodospirillaceae bacterium]